MKRLNPSERKRAFRIHWIAFVLTAAPLVAINLWIGAPYWVVYVLLAWGVGVVAHGWSAGRRCSPRPTRSEELA